MYDQNNIFAQIINKKIKAQILYEDEKIMAFKDANPAAQLHILVVPKGEYLDFADFTQNANPEEIAHYFQMLHKIAQENGADNYRLVTNKGEEAGQSVFHFHTHILYGWKGSNHLINDKL